MIPLQTSAAGRLHTLRRTVSLLFLLPTMAVAAVPVITTSSPEFHRYFVPEDPNAVQFGYAIVASNSPTSYDATGLPANAAINRSTGVISGGLDVPGVFPLTLSATNADGTGTAPLRLAIHPAIVGVSSSRGNYTTGQSFTFTLTSNRPLFVTGRPVVGFSTGTATRAAGYVSGSGTATLVFSYTVAAADDSNGQQIQLLNLDTSAGSVRDVDGLDPSPRLPLRYFSSGITFSSPRLPAAPPLPPAIEVRQPATPPIAAPPPITTPPSATTAIPATPPVVSVPAASRLINLSSRVKVRDGDPSRSLVAGFVVSGDAPKRMLVRAVGPTLAAFGVQSALANPRLRVLDAAGRAIVENDDWSGAEATAAFGRLGAFGLSTGSRDAAQLVTLPPGAYSLVVDANGSEGVALAEIYDASDAPAVETQQLINLSTRAYVGSGDAALTAGFVVTGNVAKRVLIRGIGPALAAFGVPGILGDPVLKIYAGDAIIAQNDDWQIPQPVTPGGTVGTANELAVAFGNVGAFRLESGAKDAALIVTLAPGAYTAIVSGAGGASGAGMVEVYEISSDARE